MESVTVTLFIDPTPLKQRKCMRCNGTDFRAVLIEYDEYHAQGMRSSDKHGFPILEPLFFADGSAYMRRGDTGNKDSQSTMPLSICLGCHRIAALV